MSTITASQETSDNDTEQYESCRTPEPPTRAPTPGVLKMYHGLPARLRNRYFPKEGVLSFLQVNEDFYGEFERIVAFLFTHHQELSSIKRVTTRTAKDTICCVCNDFLGFISLEHIERIQKATVPRWERDCPDHIIGHLLYQLALHVRQGVIAQKKEDETWKAKMPEVLKDAFEKGKFPKIDYFDRNIFFEELGQDRLILLDYTALVAHAEDGYYDDSLSTKDGLSKEATTHDLSAEFQCQESAFYNGHFQATLVEQCFGPPIKPNWPYQAFIIVSVVFFMLGIAVVCRPADRQANRDPREL